MPTLTNKDIVNIDFLLAELTALKNNDLNAKTIERLLVLSMELDEMHRRIKDFIAEKEPPVDGV